MLNEDFILQLIKPHLNADRELSEFEFFELFSGLALKEQYEIINMMISHHIELVEEKDTQLTGGQIPLDLPKTDIGYENMLRLTNEELCVLAKAGDTRATAAILKKNERFVYKAAIAFQKQFSQTNLTVDDLFQEGNIGLLKAIEKFDPALDYKFLTYSGHWINQQISRAAIDTGYLIRLPVHMFEKIKRINTYRYKHPEADLLTLTELIRADDGEVTPEDIQLYIKLGEQYLNTTSLNVLVGENSDSELQDFLPDQDALSVEDQVAATILREVCEQVLKTLKPKEEKILRLRFGFDDGRPHTLEEIGNEFDVTRERIRQIERKALRKLQHPTRAKYLESFIS